MRRIEARPVPDTKPGVVYVVDAVERHTITTARRRCGYKRRYWTRKLLADTVELVVDRRKGDNEPEEIPQIDATATSSNLTEPTSPNYLPPATTAMTTAAGTQITRCRLIRGR